MDQMMVNIGQDEAYCGDEVVLIGQSGHVHVTINDLVDCYGGSAYEFMVLLNSRIARRYQLESEIPLKVSQVFDIKKHSEII
jgi:alanine racemase